MPTIEISGSSCVDRTGYNTLISLDGGSTYDEFESLGDSFPINQFSRTFVVSSPNHYYDYSVTIQGTAVSMKW